MSREASQELGGSKTPGVMENVYNKALSRKVAPRMRSTINKACTLLGVQAFVVNLDNHSCLDGEEAVGFDKGQLFGPGFIFSVH